MLFDTLCSTVIKQNLMAKMQYSLGYRLVGAVLSAAKPRKLDFETSELDIKPDIDLKEAKKAFASFGDYCLTYGYTIDPISSVIESYIKGTGKQPSNTPKDVLSLRAKVSGLSEDKLKQSQDAQRLKAIAVQEEAINSLRAEFMDIQVFFNGFYDVDQTDIEDIILDSWVIENYPKVLKSQTSYWSRFNNWDDAELILIEEDQNTLASSKA
jgi:hypothetical protein